MSAAPKVAITEDDWLAIEREYCARSLANFVRSAWLVYDPASPLVWGWHIDAICLPPDTKIETQIGPLSIGEIVESRWQGSVLSANHKTGGLEWRKILCHMRTPGRGLFAFELESGIKFKATANHPVFVSGKGYVRADEVKAGDRVVEVQALPDMFQAEAFHQRNLLQPGLPLRASERTDTEAKGNKLRSVRQDVPSVSRQDSGEFLLQSMPCSLKSDTGSPSLSEVRRAEVVGRETVHGVSGFGDEAREEVPVRELQKRCLHVSGEIRRVVSDSWSFLRKGLPRGIRSWFKQRSVCGRGAEGRLWAWVSNEEAEDCHPGRGEMLSLPKHKTTGRASHRQEQIEQQRRKPSDSMQEVPRASASSAIGRHYAAVEGVVRSVVRENGVSEPLYNIEVEGNNNYFANNVLVHNCEHLEAVTAGEINRLLINIPPGTMKSSLVNVLWPAWEWGPAGLPHHRIISAAHEQGLAIRDNRAMRRVIQSEWYQSLWPTEIASDQNQKTYFENGDMGFRQACSVSSMTGRRGHRVLWDDPLSAEHANSVSHIETAIREFTETLPSRYVDPKTSANVIVMQRLHERDPSGYILDRDLGYVHLCLPMEFESNRRCRTVIGWEDPRTEEGELLFPERFPAEVVERDKELMGSYAVAGQFQQQPAPRGGGIFKSEWLRQWTTLPDLEYRMMYADTANKTGQENDFSVFEEWGKGKDGKIYLLDMIRGKWEAPQLLAMARAFWDKRKNAESSTLRKLKVEDKASGTGLIQQLKQSGIPVEGIQRSKDKVSRAYDAAPQVEAGNVLMPSSHAHLSDMMHEILTFPAASHDDCVDPLMDAVDDMLNSRSHRPSIRRL